MQLVEIEWLDSYGGTTGWKSVEDCTPDVLTVRSVGWLLHDDENVVVIVPHIVQPDPETRIAAQVRGDMCIPAKAMVRRRELWPSDPSWRSLPEARLPREPTALDWETSWVRGRQNRRREFLVPLTALRIAEHPSSIGRDSVGRPFVSFAIRPPCKG